jgi:TonB family protein
MLTKVVPIYPGLAQKMGIAGSVKIEVLVAPNGSVKSTQTLGGHPVLAQAGVEAIRYWKWEAATHETKEIVISTSILISFSWLHFQPRFWGQFAVVLLQFRASMF